MKNRLVSMDDTENVVMLSVRMKMPYRIIISTSNVRMMMPCIWIFIITITDIKTASLKIIKLGKVI